MKTLPLCVIMLLGLAALLTSCEKQVFGKKEVITCWLPPVANEVCNEVEFDLNPSFSKNSSYQLDDFMLNGSSLSLLIRYEGCEDDQFRLVTDEKLLDAPSPQKILFLHHTQSTTACGEAIKELCFDLSPLRRHFEEALTLYINELEYSVLYE